MTERDGPARLAPAAPPLDAEVQEAIDRVMRGAPPLVLFTTMARDRRLFFKYFGGGLLDRGHLSFRQREIVIDRTTALCGAEYEWGVHVSVFAPAAELLLLAGFYRTTSYLVKALRLPLEEGTARFGDYPAAT